MSFSVTHYQAKIEERDRVNRRFRAMQEIRKSNLSHSTKNWAIAQLGDPHKPADPEKMLAELGLAVCAAGQREPLAVV